MDIANHVNRYRDIFRGQLPEVPSVLNNMVSFDIEESVLPRIANIVSSQISERGHNIRGNIQNYMNKDFLPKDSMRLLMNPFGNSSGCCKCFFRTLSIITCLVLLFVIFTLIAYR
jgi:hypothetical protein